MRYHSERKWVIIGHRTHRRSAISQPPPFVKANTYTGDAYTGADLDEDFDNIETTLDAALANLALLQRDDGALSNASVTPDALSAAVLTLIAANSTSPGEWTPRGEWVIGTAYAATDIVEVGTSGSFVAVTAHTAGATFAADKAAGKWITLSGATLISLASTASSFGASLIGVQDAGSYFVGENAEAALQEIGSASRTFNTIALLRAATARFANERVAVAGYYAAADGGAGIFNWSSASTATDNGNSVIKPTAISSANPGRWLLSSRNNKRPTPDYPVTAATLPRLFLHLEQYRHDLQTQLSFVGIGSSVANGADIGGSASADAPINYFTTRFKAVFDPGSLFNIVSVQRSVDGSTISEAPAKIDAIIAEPIIPRVLLFGYGMNDGGTAIYNAGQTYPLVYTYLRTAIAKARAVGAECILMTTPHPHSDRATYSMPPAIPQLYPTAIAAPVSDAALQPPVSQSKITGDFVGNGTNITVSHRYLRVNQAMRRVATEMGVPVIDAERYWFEAVQRLGEDALFGAAEVVHPNLLGHQESYQRAIDDFIEALSKQRAQPAHAPRLHGRFVVNPTAGSEEATTAAMVIKAFLSGEIALDVQNFADGNPVLRTKEPQVQLSATAIVSDVAIKFMKGGGFIRPQTNANIAIATPVDIALPAESAFLIIVFAKQSGIGRQARFYLVLASDVGLTLVEMASTGAAVVAISSSGLNFRITAVADNTDVSYVTIGNGQATLTNI